jgi:hypothetical protein
MLTKQKKTLYIMLAAATALFFTACSDNSKSAIDEPESQIEINTVENLHAPFDRESEDNEFVYFSFRSGEVVSVEHASSDAWDIAFSGTNIKINSGVSGPGEAGAVMLDIPFQEVVMAPSNGYEVDTEDGFAITGNGGWYNYSGHQGNPPHAIMTRDNVTTVLRTGDGNHYVKLEIKSYYKNNPDYSDPDFVDFGTRQQLYPAQHFTFRYAIQQVENLRDLN